MFRKHIAHLAIVSLKFFLNVDTDLSDQVIIIAALITTCFTLVIRELVHGANTIWLKGKTAAITLAEYISHKREDENEVSIFRSFKSSFLQKDIRQWRMNRSA